MRAVIQRVSQASVTIHEEAVGSIEHGLLVLLAVHVDDTEQDAVWLAKKIAGLRIFEDDNGKLNRSVRDVGGSVLAVSQFTLYGDCRKGNRPSFSKSAGAEQGKQLYEYFVAQLRENDIPVQTGRFGADMDVALVNDGPVTLVIDSYER